MIFKRFSMFSSRIIADFKNMKIFSLEALKIEQAALYLRLEFY